MSQTFKFSDINISKDSLLQRGYRAEELIGKLITIHEITFVNSDDGEYMTCKISGEGLDNDRRFVTGAHNIIAKVRAAVSQDKFPVEGMIVKNGRSYDIE